MYRCEALSVEGFIQQIAVSYVLHGYFHFVVGKIPEHRDPSAVDTTLITRYGLDISKWTRARRRKAGQASVQYLRYGRVFVIIATEGNHLFYERERVRDIRSKPLVCFGYRISCYQRTGGRWHPSVKIAPRRYARLRRWIQQSALGNDTAKVESQLAEIPFAPFGGVVRQSLSLLRLVNKRRKCAGLSAATPNCVRRRRKPVRVFESQD
jgi:hypothetical protein